MLFFPASRLIPWFELWTPCLSRSAMKMDGTDLYLSNQAITRIVSHNWHTIRFEHLKDVLANSRQRTGRQGPFNKQLIYARICMHVRESNSKRSTRANDACKKLLAAIEILTTLSFQLLIFARGNKDIFVCFLSFDSQMNAPVLFQKTYRKNSKRKSVSWDRLEHFNDCLFSIKA